MKLSLKLFLRKGYRVRRSLMVSLLLLVIVDLQAQTTEARKPYMLSIVPRFNSSGYFPFTGAILNHNVNFDLNAVFQKNGYGVLAFKSFDLQDKKSDINYLQSAVFRQFQVSTSVNLILYVGYVFAQVNSFKDENGSDYFSAFTVNWNINKALRFENITLFQDVTGQQKIVNRMLFLYTVEKFRIDLSFHQRNVFESSHLSMSGALAVNFPKLNITRKLAIQGTVTYQRYLTDVRPDYALRDGVFASVSFPMNLSRQ